MPDRIELRRRVPAAVLWRLRRYRLPILAAAGLALTALAASGWMAAAAFSIPNTAKYAASVGCAVAVVVLIFARDARLPAGFLLIVSLPLAGISTTVGPLSISVLAVTAVLVVVLLMLKGARFHAEFGGSRWWVWVLAGVAPGVILGADAWPTVSTVAMGVGIGVIVCQIVRLPGGVPTVVGAVLVSAAGQSIIGIYQYVTGDQLNFYSGSATARSTDYFFNYDGVSRATGTLPHPLAAGNYLAIALPLAAVAAILAFRHKRVLLGIVGLAASLLCLAGLLTTLARASLIGAALALVVVAVVLPRRIGMVMVVGAAVLALVLVNAVSLLDDPAVTQRFGSMFDPTGIGVETSSGDETRVRLWQIASQTWMQHPVFGVGIGSLNAVFVADLPGTDSFTHAHNLYLQVGAETGLLGIAAIVVLLAKVVDRARQALRHDRIATAGAIGAVVAALAGSMTDTTALTGVGVAGAVGTAIGMLFGIAGASGLSASPPAEVAAPSPHSDLPHTAPVLTSLGEPYAYRRHS